MLITDVINNWTMKESAISSYEMYDMFYDYVTIIYSYDKVVIDLNSPTYDGFHLVKYTTRSGVPGDTPVNWFYDALTTDNVGTWAPK